MFEEGNHTTKIQVYQYFHNSHLPQKIMTNGLKSKNHIKSLKFSIISRSYKERLRKGSLQRDERMVRLEKND